MSTVVFGFSLLGSRLDLTISLVLYRPSVSRLLAYALALDLDTLRSYMRFVNDMLAAGTAEEVLRLAAASVPRDQWAGLLVRL